MSQNTSSAPSCETCRWFDTAVKAAEYPGGGRCRRGPPSNTPSHVKWAWALGLHFARLQSLWPAVGKDDWCGEHQPQEAQSDD